MRRGNVTFSSKQIDELNGLLERLGTQLNLELQLTEDIGRRRAFVAGVTAPDGCLTQQHVVQGPYRLLLHADTPVSEQIVEQCAEEIRQWLIKNQ